MTQQYDDWNDEFKKEQLHIAATDGDVSRCEDLVRSGHDPNVFDALGKTPCIAPRNVSILTSRDI